MTREPERRALPLEVLLDLAPGTRLDEPEVRALREGVAAPALEATLRQLRLRACLWFAFALFSLRKGARHWLDDGSWLLALVVGGGVGLTAAWAAWDTAWRLAAVRRLRGEHAPR